MATNKTAAAKKPATKKPAKKKAAPVIAADSKAKHTAMLKALDPIAKEINHRLTQAEKLTGQSNDQRLSASLRMAEAKSKCEEVKLSFKDWCEQLINLGYHNARKLAQIGSQGEDKARVLLEDLRLRSAEAQRKHVEKKKLAIAGPSSSGGPEKSPFQRAEEVVGSLNENQKVAVIDKAAKSVGRVVVSEDDVKSLVALRKKQQDEESAAPLTLAKAAFDKLVAKDKMALVQYAAKITGCTLEMPSFAAEGDAETDNLDIPEYLKRKKAAAPVTAAAEPRARRRKAA